MKQANKTPSKCNKPGIGSISLLKKTGKVTRANSLKADRNTIPMSGWNKLPKNTKVETLTGTTNLTSKRTDRHC